MTLQQRVFAGWACLVLAFVLIVLLGTGMVEPPGLAAAGSGAELLRSVALSFLVPLALFVLGLVLLRRPRR